VTTTNGTNGTDEPGGTGDTGRTGRTGGERSLARSSAVMAAGTVVSRVLGMVKALMLAAVMGFAVTGDTFDVANTLPNQFYLLLAGGILNAVLVPQITKAASHDDGGHEFVNRLLTLALASMAVATVLATVLAPVLVRINATSRWSDDTLALSVTFAFICLPQIFFYGLYTLLGQVLNARGHFAAYMWAPALANIVSMAGLGAFLLSGLPTQADVTDWTPTMIWLVAGTATLGVAAQAFALIVPLRRSGFSYRPVWGLRGVGLRSASTVALWTFAAVAVSQLAFVVTSRVLTAATDKYSYSQAFLFFMLPHSLVTVSLVTALFTRVSQSAHAGRVADVVADLGRGLRMPAVLLVPATVGGVLLAEPVLRVLLFNNEPEQVGHVAHILMAMLLGVVPYGWLYLVQRVYYAYEDARTPFWLQVLVSAIATVVNLSALVLDPDLTGIVVGVGQTLSNLAGALVGFVLLRRRLGPLQLSATVRVYVRLTVASLVACAVTWLLLRLLDPLADSGTVGATVVTVVAGGTFLVSALGLAHVLRVREASQLLAPVLRRVPGLRRDPS
jgi:putative peptidoglycan lipid II flippase